jgi:hypothetical protein
MPVPNSLKIQVWFSCRYVITAGLSPHNALFFTLYIAPKKEFAYVYTRSFVFFMISYMLKWRRFNFRVLFCCHVSDTFSAFL